MHDVRDLLSPALASQLAHALTCPECQTSLVSSVVGADVSAAPSEQPFLTIAAALQFRSHALAARLEPGTSAVSADVLLFSALFSLRKADPEEFAATQALLGLFFVDGAPLAEEEFNRPWTSQDEGGLI